MISDFLCRDPIDLLFSNTSKNSSVTYTSRGIHHLDPLEHDSSSLLYTRSTAGAAGYSWPYTRSTAWAAGYSWPYTRSTAGAAGYSWPYSLFYGLGGGIFLALPVLNTHRLFNRPKGRKIGPGIKWVPGVEHPSII